MSNQTCGKNLIGSAFAALVALAAALTLGAETSVFAQTARIEKPEKSEANAPAPGQQAVVDPQTGRLKQPTQDEAKALADAMKKFHSRSTEKLKIKYMADGAIMAELPDEYMDIMVVRIDPDGGKTVGCVTGRKAAEEFLKAQPNSAAPDPAKGAPPATPTARTIQKTITPSAKGETGKAPQKNNSAKDKLEVM